MSSADSPSSKQDQRLPDQPSSSSPPASGRRRARSSVPKLSPSPSCPHLPLLAPGTSSPPILTSAVAFGATTPTVEIFWGSGSLRSAKYKDEETTTSGPSHSRRLSMSGFPWNDRSTSGRMSPAAELTGKIVRRATTPPAQVSQFKNDLTQGAKDKLSPKSNLRLKLPPAGLEGSIGGQVEQRSYSVDAGMFNHNHRGFLGQPPLLGLAYPTTPDIGLNSSPVTCGGCSDGRHLHASSEGGVRGIAQSGAAAAAQHVLLTAAPHMGRAGGLALLTPPDDNGILDWQQEASVQRSRCGGETPIHASSGGSGPQTSFPKATSDINHHSNQNSKITAAPAKDEIVLPKTSEPSTQPEVKPEGTSTAPADVEWIQSALDVLVGTALPTCMSTEAVRVLSYTLPCPLPDAPGPDPASSSSNPTKPDRLPISATSAPAVAQAVGQQLSPGLLARCTSTDSGIPKVAKPSVLGVTTALHTLTAAIQKRYLCEGTGRVYIHVSHAIDPLIPISRLPSTPPISTGHVSSPSRSTNANTDAGYFSPVVFNSIVVAPSSRLSSPMTTPSAPQAQFLGPLSNPILPPDSLHITLLERYIPPSSPAEDAALFCPKSSILIDRLFELSPKNGCLLFIYPTKTGAMDFDREYLGPVLEPLLRKLMVLYRLTLDLILNVRTMSAISQMLEFEDLQEVVQKFCTVMSKGQNDLPPMPAKLVYGTKTTVTLNELTWREWWTQQEQTRIREVMKRHATTASQPAEQSTSNKGKETNKSAFWSGYGVPGDLAREVLDGIQAPNVRPSSKGMGEAVLASSMSGSGGGGGSVGTAGFGRISGGTKRLHGLTKRGVEVGVFVIRRGSES